MHDIVRRLIRDPYFRSLGLLVLIMTAIGTLFFWLVEGRTILQALAYAVATLAMNSPYGLGPSTTGGIVFNIVYVFLGVGLFLLFVLEAGKTMVQHEEEGGEESIETGRRGGPQYCGNPQLRIAACGYDQRNAGTPATVRHPRFIRPCAISPAWKLEMQRRSLATMRKRLPPGLHSRRTRITVSRTSVLARLFASDLKCWSERELLRAARLRSTRLFYPQCV